MHKILTRKRLPIAPSASLFVYGQEPGVAPKTPGRDARICRPLLATL
jgi:hypothetical protein